MPANVPGYWVQYNQVIGERTFFWRITSITLYLLWPPYVIGQAIIFSSCGFFLAALLHGTPAVGVSETLRR